MRKLLLRLSVVLLLGSSPDVFGAKMPLETSGAVASEPSITSIKDALSQFNSLSRQEKKAKFREMKKVIKTYKADKKAGKEVDSNLILQVILALFIPPLAVYLHEGSTNNRFWISVLLTVLGLLLFGFAGILFLGSLPSIVYALVVILGK